MKGNTVRGMVVAIVVYRVQLSLVVTVIWIVTQKLPPLP